MIYLADSILRSFFCLVAECYCGNYFKSTSRVNGDDCDYACSGKPSAACGGKLRLNVYKFDGPSHGEEGETDLVRPERDNMLGCFKDSETNRILNLTAEYQSEDMTPEVRCWPLISVACAMVYFYFMCLCLSVVSAVVEFGMRGVVARCWVMIYSDPPFASKSTRGRAT